MVRSSLAVGPMARNITRYRGGVRSWALLLLLAAGCSKDTKDTPPRAEGPKTPSDAGGSAAVALPQDAAGANEPVEAQTYPDLAAALKATIPEDARVVGFGELHMR